MNEIACSASAKRSAIWFASLQSCLGRVSIVLDVRGDSDLGVDSKLDEVAYIYIYIYIYIDVYVYIYMYIYNYICT